jgi:hypothetical protein
MAKSLLRLLAEATIPGTDSEQVKKSSSPAKVQGDLSKFGQVAKEAGLNVDQPQQLQTALNKVKSGQDLSTTDNKVLADIFSQMIRMQDDTKLMSIFTKVLKNVEAK